MIYIIILEPPTIFYFEFQILKETKVAAQTVNKENEEVAYGYYQGRKPSVGPLVVGQPINMQHSGVLAEQLEVQDMEAENSEGLYTIKPRLWLYLICFNF